MQKIKRKKVIFLIPSLASGGAERVIVTLLKYFDRRRFQLAVAAVNMKNAVFHNEIPSDVEIIDLDARRVRYALPKIVALVWKRRPDFVFSTLGHLNLALAIIRPLLPRGVQFIARESSIVSCTLQSSRWPAVWTALYRWFYRRHDLLVCQSLAMEADLVDRFGFPPQRSVIINNPVDVDFIRDQATVPISRADLAAGSIWLVAAGRMTEVKGFDLLIDAIALLADPRIRLSLLGAGPQSDALKRLAVARGVADQIEFVGFQSNPYSWFSRADAFVLSSRNEGFPNVVLEALACGTPVIATPATGGVGEILGNIPECVMAEDVSSGALAKAISEWIAGTRRRLSPMVVEPYALNQIVAQYENLFDSVRQSRR